MQLERILQSQGFGSRRECRARIRSGQVLINGVAMDDPFADVPVEALELTVMGERWRFRERVYLAMNKPAGVECSHSPSHHPSVFSLLPPPLVARGVQCIGRLDEDTTGLLLFSDDGPYVHALSSPKRHVPKVYEVTTAAPLDQSQLSRLREGVVLRDEKEPVRAAACEQLGERVLRLTLGEGRYHQVKRMIAAVGNQVEALRRVAIGSLLLPNDLAPGQWRYLEREELPAPVK